MDRIKFKKGEQRAWLKSIKHQTNISLRELAIRCHRQPKTLSDWYCEKSRIDEEAFIILKRIFDVPTPCYEVINENIEKSVARMLGGKMRGKLYKNFGTPAGRLAGNKSHPLGFERPRLSNKIAELCGIILGDGGITKYHITITLNRETDGAYADYVTQLGEDTLGVTAGRTYRDNVVVLRFSRINIVNYFLSLGLPLGHKIRNKARIPIWIRANPEYLAACIRGLIDTDGSVYHDSRYINGKLYTSWAISFTNYAKFLLDDVYSGLIELDIACKKYPLDVKIRRQSAVRKYASLISFGNIKHYKKITPGGVA